MLKIVISISPGLITCVYDLLFSVGKMYIVSVSVCCALLPAMAIIGSHAGILFRIRRAGETVLNKETTSKQSSKAELQFIRVISFCFTFKLTMQPSVIALLKLKGIFRGLLGIRVCLDALHSVLRLVHFW